MPGPERSAENTEEKDGISSLKKPRREVGNTGREEGRGSRVGTMVAGVREVAVGMWRRERFESSMGGK